MAVYFDHCLDTEGAGINTDIGWLKNNFSLLAVLSYGEDRGGSVSLFTEEGEKVPTKPIASPGHPKCYVWHPTRKIIAVGWETGEITVWNEQDKELIEAPHLHRAEVACIIWSSNGTRLISADNSGALIGWKCDSKGHLGQDPFQHHLQEPISEIILKPAPPTDPSLDINSLARAAVSGDESALDMFNWKRGGKNKTPTTFGPHESLSFFIGGASGGVYFLNDQGKCTQCFSVDTSIRKLLYYEEKNLLLTITNNLILTQHNVFGEGETKEILKVKLSGKTENPIFIWAGKGILATATGESVVRIWDLEQDDNYILSLDGNSSFDVNEVIVCLAYNKENGVLAGGTNLGSIAFWKFSQHLLNSKIDGSEKWSLQSPASVEGAIRKVEWSSTKGLLAVNTIANVYILSEKVMSFSYRDQNAVVQYGPSALNIETFSSNIHHDLKTEIQVKGIYATKDTLAVWNGKRVIIYEFSSDKSSLKIAGSFATESLIITLFEQNVYTVESNKVQVRTFQGTVKQLITFAEPEGSPVSLDVCGSFLLVASNLGVLKVYDLSRREAKPHSNPKNLQDIIPSFGAVISAKVNCTGNRVSIQIMLANGKPDHKLYFWDVELDTVQYFNFETGRGEQDDYPSSSTGTLDGDNENDSNDAERGKNQAARDIAGRYPISMYWDLTEPKLFVCEAWILSNTVSHNEMKKPSLTKVIEEGPTEVMIISLFCTSENGVLIQDSFSMPPQFVRLMGVEVPYYCFTLKGEVKYNELSSDGGLVNPETGTVTYPKRVARKIMRDFVGLEHSDKATRDAMMNFSFFLCIGNMDEAFKAIKLIKSESVWENMAKMCVKSRRLDVASVCLGNMGHARGAKALREAIATEPELDAKVAVLAVQLGLYEDAERLLKNCKRFDLLNEFYQNRGQWQKALETAEMNDRIHLRTTFYNYARYLEEQGDFQGAIPNYEKSETYKSEIPRMLVDDIEQLEIYISKSQDKTLNRWWAQYMESIGDMDTAIQYYEKAEDNFSLVRVYSYCDKIDKAAEICNTTKDLAACYYLARHYENKGLIKEAISFFQKAKAHGSAIRLSKEHGFEDQLLNSALVGRPEDIMEAARYYETKPGQESKAVMLYHKAGNYSKALELAFSTKQYDSLQQISSELDERADPELLQKCAEFFIENGQYDKAVDMLAIGKKYWEAIKICMDRTIEITEDLAEKLTPDKDFDNAARLKLLEAIAEVCMHQGAYHLATKKFTQAGNKIKAMKALLKSGDTEKIVFFAGVSRQKEIYVMAANYLQSLDWRKEPEIMKNIIAFYNKGRALDALASFYDACAQVEIDEYQNYDKALGALGEAYKCMSKAKMEDSIMQEEKLGAIKHKMTLIKKFSTARRSYQENSEEAIKQCQVLLEEKDLDSAVRIGDIYGFIIEHYASKERWKAAHTYLEELRNRLPGVYLGYYVNMKTIEAIHSALSLPMDRTLKTERTNGLRIGGGDNEEDLAEFVEEEVIDDSYSAGDKL